jgi:cytochrome c oxidase subunit 2
MNHAATVQLPEQLSTLSPHHDKLYYFVYWSSVILFVAVVGAMLFFVVRYHRSRHPVAERTKDHTVLELVWTFAPLVLLMVLFHWGFQNYVRGAVTPDNAIELRVRGKQWSWEFEYPNGFRENGVLRVPVNKPIRLVMSSDDVLHSFYVPAFRWKKDVVPGSYTSMWFQATRTGKTPVFCAEYCGTSHSGMLATIEVVTQEEYDKFLKEGVGAPEGATPAEWGKMLYTQNNCNTCHSLDGANGVGPSWKGLWGRVEQMQDGATITVDENYIRAAILKPQEQIVKGYNPVMPVYPLQDKQIDALIEFIKTLK